jgi:DNA-binding XRE family transcriptional regulator
MRKFKTDLQRRTAARVIRYFDREGKYTMEQIADKVGVSRATAFNLMQELKQWESEHTFEEEIAEVITRGKQPGMFLSDNLIMAYVNGEIPSPFKDEPEQLERASLEVTQEDQEDPLLS